MKEQILVQLLEHNNWANQEILTGCNALNDRQLDWQPTSAVHGTIRETMQHLALSQEDYAAMLTTKGHPPERETTPSLAELSTILTASGSALITFVQQSSDEPNDTLFHLSDGYQVAPWLFFVQLINHATEHREQIKSMMSAQGVEPPRIDGWAFGREKNALVAPTG